MKHDIPADELERAQARVDPLLEALRRETARLGPDADSALAFHPGGTLLVSASKDRTLRLWNPANGQLFKALEGHNAWVQGITFAAQGSRLASVSADHSVRIWDLSDPTKK